MNSSTKNAYLFKPRMYDKKNNKIGFASEVVLNVGADSYINSLAKRISEKANAKETLECSKISAFESVPDSIIKEIGSKYCAAVHLLNTPLFINNYCSAGLFYCS